MRVERLDHLVLTVTDLEATTDFYARVCGMAPVVDGSGQHALSFGDQLIKLHVWGSDIEPKAALSTPGSADLCFVVDSPAQEVVRRLNEVGVPIVAGPVERTGARGRTSSVYCRDPDGNLVELASYPELPSDQSPHFDEVVSQSQQTGMSPGVTASRTVGGPPAGTNGGMPEGGGAAPSSSGESSVTEAEEAQAVAPSPDQTVQVTDQVVDEEFDKALDEETLAQTSSGEEPGATVVEETPEVEALVGVAASAASGESEMPEQASAGAQVTVAD